MRGLRLVGWDIGLRVNGPVLIEGNPDYGTDLNDIATGGFLSNPVFQKAWKEYNAQKHITKTLL